MEETLSLFFAGNLVWSYFPIQNSVDVWTDGRIVFKLEVTVEVL